MLTHIGGLPDRMMDRIKEFDLTDALKKGAVLVDNGKIKLLGDVRTFKA